MLNEDDATLNFTSNLKVASSYYASISEFCRKLGINRQQFMKYLAGSSFPSRHSMRKICDFLGVDEFELLMPPEQFSKIISLRSSREAVLPAELGAIPKLLAQSRRQKTELSKILGYYYEYYLSFSVPNHILRSLIYIYPSEEYTLYKRVERLRREGQNGPPEVYKYNGIVTIVGERMYMFDQEEIIGAELSQTILYTNYRNRITSLSGLRMGVSGSDAHKPSASRIVMEYIGRSVSRRNALSECQLYPIDSPNISDAIREHLTEAGESAKPLRGEII